MTSRETDFTSTSDTAQTLNAGASASSTTSWSRLKDPRIVRVSRALGGKDRHSKVCTVRGLRDRRVRLSVPTAIQLYDLQDRLGLNQPSKVVDWLLNAAKQDIDELPPLQFPQATLLEMLNQSDKQGLTEKSKVVSSEEGRQFSLGINQDINPYVSTENFSASRLSSMMDTSSIPINSFVRWDPSNLTLSQSHPPKSPHHHHEEWYNFSLVYQCAGTSAQPYFHSQISAASNAEIEAKHFNFQSSPTVESSTLSARSIHLNMTADHIPSQNNNGS